MAKEKKSVIWTVGFIAYDENNMKECWEDPWTATWFAYGRTPEEAKESFRKYWERERENFGFPPNYTKMDIVHIHRGFTC